MDVKLKIKRAITFAFFLAMMTESFLLFAQCPQNNFTVSGFQLRNQNGVPFSVTDEYELGEQVNGELWVMLGGSSTNGYNMRFFFDVFINGVRTQDDQYECLFPGVQAQQNIWVPVRDFTWNWGDVVDIRDIFIHWDTGSAKAGTTCTISDKNNINSQCYGNLNGYTAAVPLFPKFDFASNGICNTTIQFTSQTIGGTPPYNYMFDWDFDNDGIFDSSLENPIFEFPSTGTYPITLRVNDGTSITTIVKDIFIDPNFGIQVDIFPTKINDESGIIYVQNVTGGTPPYSFLWTGPDGFVSTDRDIFNLKDGFYQLLVTDSNGCQQIEEYEMDIASVLNMEWKDFEAKLTRDLVKITWEVNTGREGAIYEVQRSLGNLSNFETLVTYVHQDSNNSSTKFEFEDGKFPRFNEYIYYRIRRMVGDNTDFSTVKMVKLEKFNAMNSWLVYPNPATDGNFYLTFQNSKLDQEEFVELELFDAQYFFKKENILFIPHQKINLQNIFGTLPKGMFFLKIQTQQHLEVIKLINEN